jgi:heat shock protein HtpX
VANKATAHLYIVNPLKNIKGRVNKLFSTHPPIEERIAALEKMSFDKP